MNLARDKTNIDKGWQFAKLENGFNGETLAGLDVTSWETVNLPHTWNVEDGCDFIPSF